MGHKYVLTFSPRSSGRLLFVLKSRLLGQCVAKQAAQFWYNWNSYNVGAELMTTWLSFLKQGGNMDPRFFSLGIKKLKSIEHEIALPFLA